MIDDLPWIKGKVLVSRGGPATRTDPGRIGGKTPRPLTRRWVPHSHRIGVVHRICTGLSTLALLWREICL